MLAWPRLPASLCRLVAPLRGCFPGPLFAMFVHLLAGAVVGDGRVRTVTSMLRGAGLSQLVGHGRAHRLFSRAVWDPAVLADGLVRLVAALLVPDGQPVRLVVDDTFFRQRGKKVWAAFGTHDGCAPGRQKVGYGHH